MQPGIDEELGLCHTLRDSPSLPVLMPDATPSRSPAHRAHEGWKACCAWLENLPPFWTAYALTLTETVGATILALPIAVASIGPMAGVVLLVLFGLMNMVTIAFMAEAITRSGTIRYGNAFIGRLANDYLGGAASMMITLALATICLVVLQAYYIGFSTTLENATGVPAPLWVAFLFCLGLYYLKQGSITATTSSALVVGAINVALILALTLLAARHLRLENLLYLDVPLLSARGFEPSVLHLVFGVIMTAYFGHLSVGNCAKVVLRRDASGRSLLWGAVAAQATAMLLYCAWVVAVNGAIAPQSLMHEAGTALAPLAASAGPVVHVLGSILVTLGLGMASIHFSLALFNMTHEWLPRRFFVYRPHTNGERSKDPEDARNTLSSSRRFLIGVIPVVLSFLIAEWLLITGSGSFAGLLGFLGIIAISLLTGIFPVLLLIASRRKGEHMPGVVYRFLGNRLLLASVYLLSLASIFLHGLVIWEHPFPRTVALIVGTAIVVLSVVLLRRGGFARRLIIELREDIGWGAHAWFATSIAGQSLTTDIELNSSLGQEHFCTTEGRIQPLSVLQGASFSWKTSMPPVEVKVWVHSVTPEGHSRSLTSRFAVHRNGVVEQFHQTASEEPLVLPLGQAPSKIEVMFTGD
jgi:amino acid permease